MNWENDWKFLSTMAAKIMYILCKWKCYLIKSETWKDNCGKSRSSDFRSLKIILRICQATQTEMIPLRNSAFIVRPNEMSLELKISSVGA